MEAHRRPERRIRVFGCCLPIPLGAGLLTVAGVLTLRRRVLRR